MSDTVKAHPPVLMEGEYTIVFVGSSNGVVECPNVQALRNCLKQIFPNPGDHMLGFLLAPGNWQTHPTDDFPFFVEAAVFSEADDYRVFVARRCELTS